MTAEKREASAVPKRYIVTGTPGAGKTSLLHEAVYRDHDFELVDVATDSVRAARGGSRGTHRPGAAQRGARASGRLTKDNNDASHSRPCWTAIVTDSTLSIRCAGAALPAQLTLPVADCRGAVVLLHPATEPGRDQFLFRHLARVLPDRGVAVLRYDRREARGDQDVPYLLQVDDLSRALRVLHSEVGPLPTGLWGFSQGAWVAMLSAAADPSLAFLALVGSSAVSPARQMRYGTAQQLRRAGFGVEPLAELDRLRTVWEEYQRGHLSHEAAQSVVDRLAGRSWFHLSWVPSTLPSNTSWDDMDFDPAEAISQIRCPVLAFYGEDEWVPVAESIGIWQSRFFDPAALTIHELPGTEHHPTLQGGRTVASISPDYTAALTRWLNDVLGSAAQNQA